MATTAEEMAARFVRDLSGYMVTKALGVVAQLAVADVVGESPVPVDELAAEVGADADALYRVMRALASYGYFTEVAPRAFAHTPLSELLRDGVPGSLRHYALWMAGDAYTAWADLSQTVETGQPAFDRVFGAPIFEYLDAHDASREVFNKAMAGTMAARLDVVRAEDWSDVGTLVDVGGGRGALVAAVLEANPQMRGIVVDMPSVAEEAAQHLSELGLSDRCQAVGGDFFTEVPAGGDVYLLAQILHDWSDDEAIAILRTCRRTMSDHARLIVLEQVVPPGDEPSFAKLLDLAMLVLLTGRERTEDEWRALLAAGGFELRRIVNGVRASLLEAAPV
jgi:hypothetical protein